MSTTQPNSLFIAIPNMGWLHAGLASRIVAWTRDLGAYVICPERMRPTSYARNWCAEKFLKSNKSHLLFVDADTLPPIDAPQRLLAARRPVVSAVVYQMKLDLDGVVKPVPMVARQEVGGFVPVSGCGLVEINACGFGCVLIERHVFSQIEFPWFEDHPWGEERGQDFDFCRKARKAGVPLWAYLDVVCRHRKEVDL